MAVNPCGKRVDREHAYEVWQSADGAWKWYVLKKYKSPESEACDPYARWLCLVTSPMVGERGEEGDVYVREVKANARRVK